MMIEEINNSTEHTAAEILSQCCAAERWVKQCVAKRPFANKAALMQIATDVWQSMEEPDYLAAFKAHPQIGNVDSLREKFSNTKALAAGEQSSVAEASEKTVQALFEGNRQYLEQFGFIFIVCATGKTAAEMLALLQQRLANTREKELAIAAAEQHKITQLRLEKLIQGD